MHVFLYIACTNTVGEVALMALNKWMVVYWQRRENVMLKLTRKFVVIADDTMQYLLLLLYVF
jgi:hypothetical protein